MQSTTDPLLSPTPSEDHSRPDIVAPWESPRAFIKWAFPCFLVGIGGYIGSAGLHFASYNFVHEMDAWHLQDEQFDTQHDRNLALLVAGNFSANKDPIAQLLGPPQLIPMAILDKIAMVFPAIFFLLILKTRRVELWTKVMVCTALLAASKGIIGAITTVPDSSGWEVCRNRLQDSGYDWLRQDLTFFQIVTVDFWWFPTYGHPLRYCSDMMFSGHTFFVTLYALGLYEAAHIWTASVVRKNVKWVDGQKVFFRSCVLGSVSCIAIGQQAFEIYYVLLSRFHYTSDVVVALMFTFLFYTNGAITVFAKQWAMRDLHFLFSGHLMPNFYLREDELLSFRVWNRKDSGKEKLKIWSTDLHMTDVQQHQMCGCAFSKVSGIENPPYIMPFCENEKCLKVWWQCKCDVKTYCKDINAEECQRKLKVRSSLSAWLSRGDIFVPVCCVPCCCLAGREHIYSDRGIDRFKTMVNNDADDGNNVADEVIEQMHMHEGINAEDLRSMANWFRGGQNVVKGEQNATEEQTTAVNGKSPWVHMSGMFEAYMKKNQTSSGYKKAKLAAAEHHIHP